MVSTDQQPLASPQKGNPVPNTRRRFGAPNTLSPDIAAVFDEMKDTFGPAMRALPSDRHRAFVLALYTCKPGHGLFVAAARLAGFGTTTSTPSSWATIGSRLAHDDRMQAAIAEEDRRHIRATSPTAVRALRHLVEDPKHRDHLPAIRTVLERTVPAETVHRVAVDHQHRIVAPERALERIRELALAMGLPQLAAPRTIEGECEDVTERRS